MGMEMPDVPAGSGRHPIRLVVISANDLAASAAFYSRVFGWQTQSLTSELTAVVTPGGPSVTLRANTPEGFPGVVPFIGVPEVEAALQQVEAAGASTERAPWSIPTVGTLARFRDPSGTIYGLTSAMSSGAMSRIPAPLGANPRPPAGSLCSLEMHATDGVAAGRFFREVFGWGASETLPGYMAFDPGAGIGGVFQTHTPSLPAVAYIYAGGVGEKIEEIEASGGKRLGDPMTVPEVACFGYFTDPSGTSMGLIGS